MGYNDSYAVDSVSNYKTDQYDTIYLSSPSTLKDSDIVLLYQAKGLEYNMDVILPGPTYGIPKGDLDYAGRFQYFVIIKSLSSKILLVRNVMRRNSINFNKRNAIQLVRVAKLSDIVKNLTINSNITADYWDGNKGGILAIIADTLELKADIDVSKKGFRGADPGSSYGGVCWTEDSTNLKKYNFSLSAFNFSGKKGESIINFDTSKIRGFMPAYNGGGGGNGYHSGGGGGGNGGTGGNGGGEALRCGISNDFISGRGGSGISASLFTQLAMPVAVFGGAGGCGTQVSSAFHASKGGNGGGIVFILANAIKANGHGIYANGESVSDTSSAGAGGGGAGGSVMLDITKYLDKLTISIKGGNGGEIKDITPKPGVGGGGSGGYIRVSGSVKSDSIIILNEGGHKGKEITPKATNGNDGFSQTGLIMPIKDFLFNLMPDDFEICEGNVPKEILASDPKGGSSSDFNYTWLTSWNKNLKISNWKYLTNTKTLKLDTTLTKTSYFCRIVHLKDINGNEIAHDTSYILKVTVLPKIINNIIKCDTNIVCESTHMPLLNRDQTIMPDGGRKDGKYYYKWEAFTTSWKTAPGDSNNFDYWPIKHDATKFRRVVFSGACENPSNELSFTILPKLENNLILDSQWVSLGKPIDTIKGSTAKGGDGSPNYYWQKSHNKIKWDDEQFVNVKVPAPLPFNTPTTIDTIYVRRKVESGDIFKTCLDISNIVAIYVLDSIDKNEIGIRKLDSISATICSLTVPDTFVGSTPIGGDKIYEYAWIKSEDNKKWDTIAHQFHDKNTLKTKNKFSPGIVTKKTFFKRVAFSGRGRGYACVKNSNSIEINTIPAIEKNELIHSDDTVVCSGQDAKTIFAKQPTKGQGSNYIYQWQQRKTGTFVTAIGISNAQHYQTPTYFDTLQLRRKVIAGICESYSDTLNIIVLNKLENNKIGSDTTLCKYQKPLGFTATSVNGGNYNDYKYKWQYSYNNNRWVSCNDSTPIFYQPGEIDTTTYFRRIVQSGSFNTCSDTSNQVLIRVNELPSASFISFNDSICLGTSKKIPLSITGQPNIKLQYTDGFENIDTTYNSPGNHILEYRPITQNIYTLKILNIVDDNKCTAIAKIGEGRLSSFEVPVAFAGVDTAICGDSLVLHANSGIGEGNWTCTSKAIYTPSNKVPNAIISSVQFGYQNLTWHLNNGGCKDSSKIEVIFYQPPPDPLIGESQVGPYLFKTKLKAFLPKLGEGKWTTPDASIVIANINDPESYVENLKFGKNYFQWYVTNGVCESASDTLVVEAIDIRIPEGFSPNEDNINDFFEIKGLENIDNAELIILNKWGKEVYRSKNYKNDWKGTFNGNELPLDTYFYILNVIGRTYKGFLVVRR